MTEAGSMDSLPVVLVRICTLLLGQVRHMEDNIVVSGGDGEYLRHPWESFLG